MLIVYVGPSLRPADGERLRTEAAAAKISLQFRPPIVRGDLESLCRDVRLSAQVLLLDGEFGQRLSVSVTEIRNYLATGRRMIGASSMGALRGVECRTLGMTCYGWVAQQYLDGAIDSDADVALLFEPETLQPVTIPLVNVRWLLRSLFDEQSLSLKASDAALAIARAMHYRSRFPEALHRAWMSGLDDKAAAVLLPFLAEDRLDSWDRKRLDALEALAHLLWRGVIPAAHSGKDRVAARFPTPVVLQSRVPGDGSK